MISRRERKLFEAFSFTDFEGNLYKHIPNAYYHLHPDSGNWPGYSKNGKSITEKQFRNAFAQTIKKWRKKDEERKEKNGMTILDRLHYIEKHKIIYNIHYCRAGVGFIFYCEGKIKNPILGGGYPENWKEGLVVEKYYQTFEEAVEAEYQIIKKDK